MFGVTLCAPAAHAVGPYLVTDLGPFGPTAINDHGVIVGRGADSRPARWHNGVQSGLGIASFGAANSINNAGRIVGTVDGPFQQAFVQDDNGSTTFLTHFHDSYALDVNAAGTFVGWAYQPAGGVPPTFGPRAYVNQVNNWIPRGDGRFAERAVAVNDNGVVIGHSGIGEFSYNGTGNAIHLSGIDHALDINNAGDIVGWNGVTDQTAVLRRANGTIVQLPRPPGVNRMQAAAVNESLHIVGYLDPPAIPQRAFIWTQTTGTVDLNTVAVGLPPGWVISSAIGVNEAGQIIGFAQDATTLRSILLTPVPEPGASGLLSLAAALARRRRRHQRTSARS
jgi:hypothetical protein